MEIEYFVREADWKKEFEKWREEMISWMKLIGLSEKNIHELEVEGNDLAHYSKRTIDFEYDFPFGKKELYGLAYRTDYDLKRHSDFSKVDLSYYDEESKERFIPHCIEPSFGLDRTLLAVLCNAYREDDMDGEKRVYLKLVPAVAPYKVAVFPLLRNKPELIAKAEQIYKNIKDVISATTFDDNGNIGKRYRRQDEIGTPYCVTIDYDSLTTDTVTVRERDTMKQERVPTKELSPYIMEKMKL